MTENEKTAIEEESGVMPDSKRLVIDTDACIGCCVCELTCSVRHFGESSPQLSAIHTDADFFEQTFAVSVCRQCEDAPCVSACKLNAMGFDEATGARYIDKEACAGCGLCVKACPYGSEEFPPIHRSTFDGERVIIKCDLCHGYSDGPACVAVCPVSALSVQ